MADKNELKNMVLMFRVSELQLLLGLTSQSRCGRKTELLTRALNMVERGVSSHVQNKIRELYQRFVTRGSSATSISNHVAAPSLMNASAAVGRPPVSSVHKGLNELLNQHNGAPPVTPASYPEVRFKHLPFYDVIAELVKPVSLIPRNSTRQQEMKISMCFTQEHLKQFSESRDMHPNTRAVQVQMRFCVLDVSTRQPDCFPTTICVKVNNAIAPLPNPIPTNKPGAVPKRPSRPVDITQLCRFSASMTNSVTISWTVEDNKHYCVALYLVRKLNSQILLDRLQRSSILNPEHTKKLISEKLTLDSDNDLALTSLRVSLLCPLGKMRMKIPCRSQACDHLQCFDAITFLQMNEKKPTWVCPVCDRPADFSRLIIDGFISEIIRDSNDSTEIELTRDGKWFVTRSDEADDKEPDSPKMEENMNDGPSADEVIDLTGSDDEGDYCYEPEDSKESLQSLKKTMEAEMKAANEAAQKTISQPTVPLPPTPVALHSDAAQPIALTINNRTASPRLPILQQPPPLPSSPPPANHARERSLPPIPPENPHHHLPPLPPSPPPPPLPRTPPKDRATPPLPPAAHQHHPTPSPYLQPFDLSTGSKLPSSSATPSSSISPPSSSLSSLAPPIPPSFPFPCLPGFMPPAFHPAHPFFGAAASYEAWAHLHSAPDATAAGMLDFFSMMHAAAGMPEFAAGFHDYSAAAAAFGAMNPFAMSSPALMDYFYRSASSSSTNHMEESSSHRGNLR